MAFTIPVLPLLFAFAFAFLAFAFLAFALVPLPLALVFAFLFAFVTSCCGNLRLEPNLHGQRNCAPDLSAWPARQARTRRTHLLSKPGSEQSLPNTLATACLDLSCVMARLSVLGFEPQPWQQPRGIRTGFADLLQFRGEVAWTRLKLGEGLGGGDY